VDQRFVSPQDNRMIPNTFHTVGVTLDFEPPCSDARGHVGVQAVGDMLDQLGPPPGFGHVYSTDYVKGWAGVAPPDGWTEADTARLEQLVTTVAGGESEP
jgi:hypothetical protein